jgi:hypothetical protein
MILISVIGMDLTKEKFRKMEAFGISMEVTKVRLTPKAL